MAGVPLTLGFIGKDGAYEALLDGNRVGGVAAGPDGAREHLLGLAGADRRRLPVAATSRR